MADLKLMNESWYLRANRAQNHYWDIKTQRYFLGDPELSLDRTTRICQKRKSSSPDQTLMEGLSALTLDMKENPKYCKKGGSLK